MAKFTNISNGPRGLNTVEGVLLVDPGETVDVDLAKGDEPSEEWFAKAGTADARKAAKEAGE